MKYFLALLCTLLFVSCTKDVNLKENNDYWSCEQLPDTTGLKLYPFVPFTDKEMRTLSYDVKLERRQIPEDFLSGMSTKALFYQLVYTDLSKSMLLFNTMQQGFESTKRLNMLPELLSRPDAGHVLLGLLQKTDPAKIDAANCFWWFHCLQITLAQPEVINSMEDWDTDSYVIQQIRCHDTVRSLCEANNPNWVYPGSVEMILFGLSNVMIKYKYEPFISQMLNWNPTTNEYTRKEFSREEYSLQVIYYAKQFIESRKK